MGNRPQKNLIELNLLQKVSQKWALLLRADYLLNLGCHKLYQLYIYID